MCPDDPEVRWDRAYLLRMDDADLAAKRDARACFVSQISRPPAGLRPVLSPDMLAHSDRPAELLFREPRSTSAPLRRFAALYTGEADPWRDGSWYERRSLSNCATVWPVRTASPVSPTWTVWPG
jgi:hypothetical protein